MPELTLKHTFASAPDFVLVAWDYTNALAYILDTNEDLWVYDPSDDSETQILDISSVADTVFKNIYYIVVFKEELYVRARRQYGAISTHNTDFIAKWDGVSWTDSLILAEDWIASDDVPVLGQLLAVTSDGLQIVHVDCDYLGSLGGCPYTIGYTKSSYSLDGSTWNDITYSDGEDPGWSSSNPPDQFYGTTWWAQDIIHDGLIEIDCATDRTYNRYKYSNITNQWELTVADCGESGGVHQSAPDATGLYFVDSGFTWTDDDWVSTADDSNFRDAMLMSNMTFTVAPVQVAGTPNVLHFYQWNTDTNEFDTDYATFAPDNPADAVGITNSDAYVVRHSPAGQVYVLAYNSENTSWEVWSSDTLVPDPDETVYDEFHYGIESLAKMCNLSFGVKPKGMAINPDTFDVVVVSDTAQTTMSERMLKSENYGVANDFSDGLDTDEDIDAVEYI